MSSKHHRTEAPAANTDLGLERIVFFTDAVMAIAMTLLAIDLRVPELAPAAAASQLPDQLAALAPRGLSFAVSFLVVAIYWTSHHRYFGVIKRYDYTLIALNLVFLFFIVLMPFIASLLGHYPNVNYTLSIYAIAVSGIGATLGMLWRHASRNHRLIDKDLDPALIRRFNSSALIGPIVFIASVPVTLLSPAAAIFIWCLSPLLARFVLRP